MIFETMVFYFDMDPPQTPPPSKFDICQTLFVFFKASLMTNAIIIIQLLATKPSPNKKGQNCTASTSLKKVRLGSYNDILHARICHPHASKNCTL